MKYKVFKAGKYAAQIASVLMWNQFRYPQPVRGRYDVSENTFEKLKWAYKCWVNQLERAEKHSGIESFFAGQRLRFGFPDTFQEQSRISMSAGGDLMAVDCLSHENTACLFDGIADFYFDADIVCANLESTVYDKAPWGRNQVTAMPPKMNTSCSMLRRFLNNGNGINYFSTANNHCYDYEEEGLLATLDCLEQENCYFSGTNRTCEAQEDVLIIEKNGLRAAMLSYTCDMNGNRYDKQHLINEVRFNDEVCDFGLVERQICRAREKKADLIVASVHWGWEFEMYPHRNIIEAGHRLAELGVDVILGSHPHVSQPMERYVCERGGHKRECLIVYSLGDFVSYHPLSRNSKITYTLKFDVAKGLTDGKTAVYISNLRILPVYIMAAELADDKYDCRLLPFFEVLKQYEEGQRRLPLKEQEWKDIPRLHSKVLHGILLPELYEKREPQVISF